MPCTTEIQAHPTACGSSLPIQSDCLPLCSAAADGEDDAHHIILYYKYVSIPPSSLAGIRDALLELCNSLTLVGRIRVASEGINGSNSGSAPAIAAFVSALSSSSAVLAPFFSGMAFKHSSCSAAAGPPFLSLSVTLTAELTSTGRMAAASPLLCPASPSSHLSPSEFHALLLSPPPSLLLLDVRNYYEAAVGRFPDAVDPRIRSFSQLACWVDQNVGCLRGRTVAMYCTGGVRCEKAAVYLQQRGVRDVLQLQGGVHEYLRRFGADGLWLGKLTVFDRRQWMQGGRQSIGSCVQCAAHCDVQHEERRCSQCRCLVLTCDACFAAAASAAQPVLCEEHCVMTAPWHRVRAFLRRYSTAELLRLRHVLSLCCSYAVDVRAGKTRRHRNRRQQLETQRGMIDREIAERRTEGGLDAAQQQLQQQEDDREETEDAAAVTRRCSRAELQRRKEALLGDAALLPFMPLLNSASHAALL